MNINLRKKIYLIIASFAWCLSPYTALAAADRDSDIIQTSPVFVVAEPQYKVISSSIHPVTAYTSEVAQCDESPCITANGFNVCTHNEEDVIAANFLKFGTKVRIPELFGDRIFTVQDRMNSRFPNHVDVGMKDHTQAIQFGVTVATIEVVELDVL